MRSAPPRWASTPSADSYSWGEDAVRFAGAHGLVLDEWQRDALVAALGWRGGRWASFEVGICCPRQNGKSALLEALMLASLFLDGGLTVYSAHEFKTSQELYRRVDALIVGSPDLDVLVKRRVSNSHDTGFELHDGSRLRFLARSGGSGRGFAGARLIFDEAMILSAESMGALLPTLSAQPNPQVWYAGSAGMVDSTHWRAVRDRGRAASSDRLTWFEWGCESPEPDDRQAWAQANPSLGIRLREDVIEAEFDALATAPDTLPVWLRERLGVWDEPELQGAVIGADVWVAHAEPERRITGVPVFALDVSPNRSMSALAVAGDADGRPMVEIPADGTVVDHRAGTAWVVPRLVDLTDRYGGNTVYLTGTAAEALRPDLVGAGLVVEALTGPQLAAACGAFFDAATMPAGRGLVHAGQPELGAALALARRAETDHGWQWGRRKSAGDITPLVAATVALWAHTSAPPGDPSAYWI